ncbi:DUF5777 family beta-barrel protein [Flavobacterium sp.]|uniref:DUF5777 family beta-barrel protein n=1 Tax=Flavobacterium sp. TaxID=239 RepID=UPI001B56D9B4|nr:DUF5777 family beta-barrel protein [Flavobacterium sp.]MBP6181722.1 hypothetical protein [Flavobacterium sp.]
MKIKNILTSILFIFSIHNTVAQEDLLDQLDVKSDKKEVATATFKALQICNIQSTKLPVKGELYILISHRFGDLTEGLQNFFGLDDANTKIGGIYGATNWLSLGVSRHTFQKTYELGVKYKLANQMIGGFPVTIVGYNTLDINSELDKVNYPQLQFGNRLAYSSQLLISRKITESFSFELAPMYTHKNLYDNTTEYADLLLLGYGARYKVSKRLSVNLEYATRMRAFDGFLATKYKNPLSVGLDIETGGHVFQMVFSNSQAMNDVSVLSNSTGKWENSKGIYFGFNMYRVF